MATNRIDILDPALLRPGRIDRKIEFPPPNEEARLDILKIHSRKMNLTRGINLRKIAELMPGASGAEVKVYIFATFWLVFSSLLTFHTYILVAYVTNTLDWATWLLNRVMFDELHNRDPFTFALELTFDLFPVDQIIITSFLIFYRVFVQRLVCTLCVNDESTSLKKILRWPSPRWCKRIPRRTCPSKSFGSDCLFLFESKRSSKKAETSSHSFNNKQSTKNQKSIQSETIQIHFTKSDKLYSSSL